MGWSLRPAPTLAAVGGRGKALGPREAPRTAEGRRSLAETRTLGATDVET